MKILSTVLLLSGLVIPVAGALAGPAHQHGVARLDVAVEAGRVVLYLETPLDNLLGFERAPRSEAERRQADAALARLRTAEGLFRIDGQAGCRLGPVTLRAPVLGLGSPAAGGAQGHADLEGQFEFSCTAGARASFIEVALFEAFPQMKRIELQLMLPRGQMKATLVRPATRVALAR